MQIGGQEYRANGIVKITVIEENKTTQMDDRSKISIEGPAIGVCLGICVMAATFLVYKMHVSLVSMKSMIHTSSSSSSST